ncbi:MAG: type II toxin-antitoxin system VapC family toxin [Alphaproteobacteria bacterium]
MTLVVDASVACKWFLDEVLADEAFALAEREDDFLAPDLILAEVANAVWKHRQRGEIGRAQASDIIARVPTAFRRLLPIGDLVGRAFAIAETLEHPMYDCFYLAASEETNVVLVTADGRLARRVVGTPWEGRVHSLSAGGISGR